MSLKNIKWEKIESANYVGFSCVSLVLLVASIYKRNPILLPLCLLVSNLIQVFVNFREKKRGDLSMS
ncbi:MAG: hypothetical protein K5889_02450 [Lachnospiraceae bacterium]|nr:hypothetical protein [Lachnospiraceae bacterium]